MSENTQKEQEIQTEETLTQEPAAQENPTEDKAVRKEEKKGFMKNGKKDKAKIEELEKKVAELEEKTAKDRDDYIRLMAEFDNYRRRTSQEKLELVSMASMETIKGLLPVLGYRCKAHLSGHCRYAGLCSEAAAAGYHRFLCQLQSLPLRRRARKLSGIR